MGLLSWLFPSPEDRVERARRMLEARRFRDARDELDGIALPAAEEVRRAAKNGLVQLNLDEALRCAEAGDFERVQVHLDLADEFHDGGLEEQLRATRRQVREIRTSRQEEVQRKQAEQARQSQVDPLGLTGRGLLENRRDDGIAEDDEERQQRLWMILENYPADLRDRAGALGRPFLDALLDLEDGRPDLALQAFLALPDDEPLVCFERARCAWSMGDPAAAGRALRAFADAAGGHRPIGPEHTGVMLAQVTAETGDLEGAIRVLRGVRAKEPLQGALIYAQLLLGTALRKVPDATARLAEAEEVLRELIARVRQPALYGLLARVRLAGGHRVPAMRALEQSLEQSCSTPGKCGAQPPDPAIQRMLATLYLEDGLERDRALELADEVLGKVQQQPAWEDRYLEALVGRVRNEPDANEAIEALWGGTKVEDPRRELLERYLPLAT